jgi:tetratricopeptide (TPR) repeat protein
MLKQFAKTLVVGLVVAGCGSNPPDEHAKARSVANKGAPIEVDRKSEALFENALDAIRAQRYTEAESLLKELTTRQPGLSGPWVNLGSVYEALGDNDSAEGAYKRAIDANPSNCAAYVDLGVLARRSGDFLTAEANYLACIQRVPDFREAYLNLGILYELYLGRLDDALKSYQQYQALTPDPDLRVAGWVSDLERRIAGNQS